MENASKALIIAGAILLGVLLIGLGVFVYNQASTTVNSAANMDQLEVARFNGQFEPYISQKEISGTTAKSLIQAIESSNYASEPQVYCAGVTQFDIKRAHTYETLVEYDHGVINQILLKDLDDNVVLGETGSGETGIVLTQAYVRHFFTEFLNRPLNRGEVEHLLNNLEDCNKDIITYQDTVIDEVRTVEYYGPRPLDLDDARTYTAETEENKNEYVIILTVTANPLEDEGDDRGLKK